MMGDELLLTAIMPANSAYAAIDGLIATNCLADNNVRYYMPDR